MDRLDHLWTQRDEAERQWIRRDRRAIKAMNRLVYLQNEIARELSRVAEDHDNARPGGQ